MSRISAPKGTRDIFLPDILSWHFLEDGIRDYYERFLYSEIRTPIFEHSDLFQRGIGGDTEVVQKEMYTFVDKANRSLTLRPENTASVVRACLENNLFNTVSPLRFYYIGPMFRYDKPQKGRFRQFHQFGIEVFDDDSPEVDAEVIYSAVRFLEYIGIKDTNLLLNSVGCLQCRPGYLRELAIAAAGNRESLCSDCQRKINSNPLRIFDCKNENCQQLAADLPKITDFLCGECYSHFSAVKLALAEIGITYVLDPLLVRGLDYYTKTAFEITSSQLGAQDSLLGGGRYNDLVKELGGPDMPGIGFAAGMERIILHLGEQLKAQKKVLVVVYQSADVKSHAIRLSFRLREAGYNAYLDYRSRNLKKQFKMADRLGADYTFIIGENELQSGKITLKDMSAQTQIQIVEKDLIEWLKVNV